MGEITSTSTMAKVKQGGGSSINRPMLSSTNYTVWAIRTKTLLKVQRAWDISKTKFADIEKNDMTVALIFQSITEELVLQVGDIDNTKKI